MATHIFYHSAALDGHCSGAIAYDALRKSEGEVNAFAINYGQEFPFHLINKEDTVYMLDFSLQPYEDMKKLNNMCRLIWIDHHKSAIEEAEKDKGTLFLGSREVGKAGCELTWEYFHSTTPMPKGVYFLGRYDVWDLVNPDILKFQYGLRGFETFQPTAEVWKKVLDNTDDRFTEYCVQSGGVIVAYNESTDAKYIKSYGFEVEFEGLKGIACNKGMANSKLFNAVKDNYELLISFVRAKEGHWTVSLYTEKDEIDCSVIAKKYGGGGHKSAAGMVLSNEKFMELFDF